MNEGETRKTSKRGITKQKIQDDLLLAPIYQCIPKDHNEGDNDNNSAEPGIEMNHANATDVATLISSRCREIRSLHNGHYLSSTVL